MSAGTVQQLELYGPDRCQSVTIEEARHMCRKLVKRRYENFSVLSRLVPGELRDDVAAVYAFCRWADDLGDEIRDSHKALELLGWWRRELHQCFAGEPRHPVFVALAHTISRHELPIEPFDDLIRAFEQDQTTKRYETWDELLNYCTLSANPVGRLVLMMCGEPRTEEIFSLSDKICTALQLTNHWQDVARDIIERDRIYIPLEMIRIERFEERLLQSAIQGYGVDRDFLGEARSLIRSCIERTWPLYEQGNQLLQCIGPASRPIIWLFAAGGQRVLHMIQMWNYETALHRPALSKMTKLGLVARAWWQSKTNSRGKAVQP
jgi:squalene synthase HpnC